MNFKMKNRVNTIFLIASFFLFVLGIVIFSYTEYQIHKTEFYAQIDQKLRISAHATDMILSPDFHDRALDASSITIDEYNRNIDRLSTLSKSLDVIYIYTMVQRNGKIYFTSSNATDEERKTGVNLTRYFDHYDDASDVLKKVFTTRKTSFDEYTDKWGRFRSIFIPMKSPGGHTYVIAADIRTDVIDKQLRDESFNLLLRLLVTLLFALPFLTWHFRRINRSLHEEKEILSAEIVESEKNLRNAHTKLRAILDATQETILLLDRNGTILAINTMGAKRFGQEADALVGQSILTLLPQDVAQRRKAELEKILLTEKSISFEDSWHGLIFSFHCYPVYNDNGYMESIAAFGKDITESKHLEEDLKAQRQHLLNILWSTGAGTWELNLQTNEIRINAMWTEMLGYTLQELSPHNYALWEKLCHPDDLIEAREKLQRHLNGESDYYACEFRMRHKTGHWVWIQSRGKVVVYTEDKKPLWIAGVHLEITERKLAENELRKLSQAVEQSPASIIITDLHGNIEYANKTFYTTSGYSKEETIGKNPRLLQSGKTPKETYKEIWKRLLEGKNWQGEFINRNKDGRETIQLIHISPIFQSNGKISHYMAIEENITEKKSSEERIHYLSNFDALTQLPNKSQFETYCKYILSLAHRSNSQLAVLFLDLDHFKNFNDSLGHKIGDLILVETAKRLKSLIRESDIVARFSADEFVLIFSIADIHSVEKIAQKILNTINEPYHIDSYELSVTASIGISLYPSDGSDLETLSKNSETAMYRAKHDGRNSYRFVTEEMQTKSLRYLQLSNALHNALKNNELHVVYQPQISLHSGDIIGAEALLRWNHPELGAISPAEFIPIAEETGLILPIGEWVLHTALSQASVWKKNHHLSMIMAINLSAVQFRHPNLIDMVIRILEDVSLPPECLELELTESMAMENPDAAIAVMNTFFAHGIRMSIDDFGTGYSSLSYLKQFKISKLKIDQSFVRHICTNADDKAITNAIIHLAHSLGLQTIAEGVETIQQLEVLRAQGCDEIQGYYYSKPCPADEFQAFAAHHKGKV